MDAENTENASSLVATDGKRGWQGNPGTKWTFLAGKIMENHGKSWKIMESHGTIAGYLPFGVMPHSIP